MSSPPTSDDRRGLGWRPTVAGVASLILAYFWLKSGVAHLTNPYRFLGSVYVYGLLGVNAGMLVAMILPTLQLTLVVALLTKTLRGGALLASALLLAAFSLAQVSVLLRRLRIECGCFGPSDSTPIGRESLFLVLSLFAVAVLGLSSWACMTRRAGNTSSDRPIEINE